VCRSAACCRLFNVSSLLLTRLAIGYPTDCTCYIVYRCVGRGAMVTWYMSCAGRWAMVTWCVSVTSQRNVTRSATLTSLPPALKHFMLKPQTNIQVACDITALQHYVASKEPEIVTHIILGNTSLGTQHTFHNYLYLS
jgi:hypothetical protein